MRGKGAPKRTISPDPKFNSLTIAKLVNYVMERGKKTTAQKVVYDAFDLMAEKTKQDPVAIFDRALKNVTPILEVRSRRVGGANYQVPVEVRGERKLALAFRWLLLAANTRRGAAMAEKLADELMAAARGEGTAIKKREDVHRMAEANRAFAHFAS
ncbi:MAG: 30S ribosomal protein S7 [Candidatus Komeilibacteria bacterium RIFCSPLOWO2_02_FULL_48_11]|uniref:Small ribosomal subunit protein uS7 n=1 Tax=Candidatus Komeilibacteria bacterium RIFCSPLOWO2_02_FULL_48_11 TaxID=1798553 RepID=A0A1G2BTX0_9BACT|nr:MAG: 30S ribosomal protein S7 [Candidatus Komeilibacteria bacterium RIFCSPLOWO2_02_FULL_48_11]